MRPGDLGERPQPILQALKDRVLRAGGWVTAGFVLDKMLAVGQMMVVARLLMPADFGVMAASAAVVLAATTLAELGIEPALVTRREIGPADLPVAWTLSVGRSFILAAVLWALADLIAAFFRFPGLGTLLRVHTLALLIQGMQSPAMALLIRSLDLDRRVRLDLVRRLVEVVGTIGLAWWLRSVWALLVGQLMGFAVGCVLSYRVAPFKPRFSLNRDSLTHFLQYGKHFNPITILTFGVMNTGEFVVGRILGAEVLGIYQVALAIPMLVGLRASIMMSQVSVPAFAILRQNPPGAIRAFGFQIGVMSLALIPLATGVALLASDLVRLFFGQRWTEAAGPLQMLCPYAVFAGLSGVMGSLHYGLGRPDLQTRIWLVQFLVYAAVIVPLTWLFGLMGAAAALTLSFAVGFVHHAAYTLHLLGTEVWAVFSALGRVAWPVVALGGVLVLTLEVPVGPVAGSALAICGLVGTTAFALYLWRIEYPRLVGLWKGQKKRGGSRLS